MNMIYLSPHLDDVALSCGGLVWEQANSGDRPQIWSICAGDPPEGQLSPFAEELHLRWQTIGNSSQKRRLEDVRSCTALMAAHRHFSIPDCIYRRSPRDGHPLYASEEAIFWTLEAEELPLVDEVCISLRQQMPAGEILVSPLSIGGHVDHRLVRAAAEKVGKPLWFYADYPYVQRLGNEITLLVPPNYLREAYQVSENGMQAWFDSVAAHRSQISTFWSELISMRNALRQYYQEQGGIPLWKPATP